MISSPLFITLPNEVIFMILERVPLHDLLSQVSLTSVQLCQLVRHACARRRSISLIFGNCKKTFHFSTFHSEYITSPNSAQLRPSEKNRNRKKSTKYFKYPHLDWQGCAPKPNIVRVLIRIFPHIQKLQLSIYNKFVGSSSSEEMSKVMFALLRGWEAHLVSLHLSTDFWPIYSANRMNGILREASKRFMARMYTRLFDRLNQMATTLRCVILCIDHSSHLSQVDLSVLPKLEVFYLYLENIHETDLIVPSLRHLETGNHQLGSIGFGCSIVYGSALGQWLMEHSRLNLPLTHLTFGFEIPLLDDDNELDQPSLVDQFDYAHSIVQPYRQSLFSLWVSVYGMRAEYWATLIRLLASRLITEPGSGIEYLHLTLKSIVKVDPSIASNSLKAEEEKEGESVPPLSLPSIRYLYIHLENRFQHRMFGKRTGEAVNEVCDKLQIRQLFPNLIQLRISNICLF